MMDTTLLKGLDLLERMVAAGAPLGVSALAQELGLPKSNIHRTLNTLLSAGYLLYDPEDRHYYPSLKLAHMGQRVTATFPFRTAMLPHLRRLSDLTGESAHFVVLEGESVVFLSGTLPRATIASVIPDNLALAWNDSAFGVALRRAGNEADAMPDSAFPPGTELLDGGVAALRAHGSRSIFEIAAPVHSNWGAVIGAIGITGPAERLDEARLVRHTEVVRTLASELFMETARRRGRGGAMQEAE